METDKNVKGKKGDPNESEMSVIMRTKPEKVSSGRSGSKAFIGKMPEEI